MDFNKIRNTKLASPYSYPWFIWTAVKAALTALGLLIFWYMYNSYQNRKFQQLQQQPPAVQLLQTQRQTYNVPLQSQLTVQNPL